MVLTALKGGEEYYKQLHDSWCSLEADECLLCTWSILIRNYSSPQHLHEFLETPWLTQNIRKSRNLWNHTHIIEYQE
ncbi:unnamed protein product [Arabidopsis thaliana]|uniref:(thale cress) hypothetical protein n=1 Tax=Arabidopsis thaliana TaxID=3702 RepID=A0A7G2E1G1_ARATH|nr:unnamed protein product [Arabidopsis thaliana]